MKESNEPTRAPDEIAKGIWGYSIHDWKKYDPKKPAEENPLPHFFRNRRCIHPTRSGKGKQYRGQYSYLFVPRREFDPETQPCCPDCRKQLAMEKIDAETREKKNAAKV